MRRTISFTVLALLLIVSVYVYWYYFRVYSDGTRVGTLQKISRKGNVFKTYEGELIQEGFANRRNGQFSAQYFYFSVSDEATAAKLEAQQSMYIKVHYVQYQRSLPWRGENYGAQNSEPGQYMVDAVEPVSGANGAPQNPGAGMPGAAL